MGKLYRHAPIDRHSVPLGTGPRHHLPSHAFVPTYPAQHVAVDFEHDAMSNLWFGVRCRSNPAPTASFRRNGAHVGSGVRRLGSSGC